MDEVNSKFIRYDKKISNNGKGVKIAIIDCAIKPYNKGSLPSLKVDFIDKEPLKNSHGNVIYDIIWNKEYGLANESELYHYVVTNNKGVSSLKDINTAIKDCVRKGVDIINLSLMYLEHNVNYLDNTLSMFTNKGGIIIASSGNENINKVRYPSSRQDIISVGDYDYALGKSGNIGNTGHSLDITAPCTNIYLPKKYKDNNEHRGTSFGSAYVTGVIAQVVNLLKENDITYNHYMLKEILEGAKVKSSIYVGRYGYLDYTNIIVYTNKYITNMKGGN